MNTKTLREQTNEIMAERSSQSVKREKLIKIGLTESDIRQLFFADRLAKKIAKQERAEARTTIVEETIEQIIARYTFGVEIECFNVRPTELINNARERGLNMHHEGYNHNDNDRYYKLVSDCSINGVNPIECVSPVLHGDNNGFDSLKACCASLNAIDAKVNRSTGLHVHVGGNITEKQYCNTFANYYLLENVIDTFMSPSRRDNRYASSLIGSCSGVLTARTFEGVREAMHNNRYFKINCMSWGRHHTIEFRQHQGTTDYNKISYWARFCIKLVHWSAENRLTETVRSINDIPFLNDDEKSYFMDRANTFANMVMA